ncbi:MAG TPA: hypothetical protein VM286_10770 [Candidatus Thermoplasmatota archaeon]|nr:hypothetical protein [Candidatus Thermoplasmatota archaeon]
MRIPAADRFIAFIGYVPFLFFIPVRFKRDSLFAQFHGRQSGVLWGLWFVVSLVVLGILFFLPDGLQRTLSVYFFGAFFVVSILYAFMAAIGMIKVLLGERYRMPVVADVALRLRL